MLFSQYIVCNHFHLNLCKDQEISTLPCLHSLLQIMYYIGIIHKTKKYIVLEIILMWQSQTSPLFRLFIMRELLSEIFVGHHKGFPQEIIKTWDQQFDKLWFKYIWNENLSIIIMHIIVSFASSIHAHCITICFREVVYHVQLRSLVVRSIWITQTN